MKLFECYSNGLNNWKETTIDEVEEKFNLKPKFLEKFYFLQIGVNNNCVIYEIPTSEIYFNHQENTFIYITKGGQIHENKCFESRESLINEYNNRGGVILQIPLNDGTGRIGEMILEPSKF